MKEPLVSVIIPCYNVEKYMEEAIESVLRQTYDHVEIILVDDGSTDGTSKLCDSFSKKNENVRVIHKENGGLSSARNEGLAEAKGKYIYFLDSDDYIKNETIENLVHKMEDNDLDAVLFGNKNIDEGGNVIDENVLEREDDTNVYRGIEAYTLFLETDVYAACVPFYMYKKDFLDSFSLRFADGIIHEDELFSFDVYRLAQRIMIDKNKYYFRRRRENSIMKSYKNSEKKFESTVWISNFVTNKSNLSQFSDNESMFVLLFLKRIQDLMCARFSEMTWAQRRAMGREYRKCLKKYIVFAISKKQFVNIRLTANRYFSSLYSFFKINE